MIGIMCLARHLPFRLRQATPVLAAADRLARRLRPNAPQAAHEGGYNRGMPIYEYACLDCNHRFETLVRGSSMPECPSCRGTHLQKQLSVFAVASRQPATVPAPGPCSSCGDPRGPGSCSLN